MKRSFYPYVRSLVGIGGGGRHYAMRKRGRFVQSKIRLGVKSRYGFQRRSKVRRRSRRVRGRRFNRRRRSVWNQNGPPSRLFRLKNVTEAGITYNLAAGSTTTGLSRVQTAHTNWVPTSSQATQLQTGVWNGYSYKKLIKFNWKMTNLRAFVTTSITTAAVGSAPAQTSVTTTEVRDWTYWYWRLGNEINNTIVPAAGEENVMQKLCVKDCNSAIWGKVPLNSARMNSFVGTYPALVSNYGNSDTYLFAFGNNSAGVTPATGTMATPDIYLMPDDPYPTAFYSIPNVTTSVNLSIIFDMITYTTWRLSHVNV